MIQSVKKLEMCRVTPFTDSTISAAESSLPLTHFDTVWIKFFPFQRVFFYQLAQHESTHTFFNSVLIPKLKHSLSLTLTYFLPLAGNLIWPVHTAKPLFLYTPNDSVSFIVAESDSDFSYFSHNKMCEAADIHPYVPELTTSDSKAEIISFQITFFPNQGFSLGVCMHHAMFDGKSEAMFMRSWAHICKENSNQATSLPLELTPAFDRTVVHDPEGMDMFNLTKWLSISDPNLKSLKLLQTVTNMENLVRANFEFSREDINKLKQNVVSHLNEEDSKNIHLSTFVVSYAYIIVSMVKAKNLDNKGKVGFMFASDWRSRLNPPLPANYFGNCVEGSFSLIDTKIVLEKNGIVSIAIELSEMIKELETRARNLSIEQEKDDLLKFKNIMSIVDIMIGVAGSPIFEIYGTDFGWGKPTKTQVVSIDKNVSISMAESRDGNRGIEIGLVMKKHEMDMFNSLIVNGLKDM